MLNTTSKVVCPVLQWKNYRKLRAMFR